MPRIIKSPNQGSVIINAISPEQGGHGEVTAADALEAMDLVSRDSIGKFGRPIPLDNNGYIDQRYLQDLYATMETVSGDLTIEVNKTKEYFLTGYDAFSSYDVRAVAGMVSVDRNVITYTAPGQTGQGGFTINGRMVAITVTAAGAVKGIAAPVVVTPVRGTAGLTGPVSVTSSAFVTDNAETHVSTSWQCAEDPGFTVIVASMDQSTTHKTSWSIGTVMLGKHYFIRAKYHGSGGGVSPWSEETHFTSPVPTPADRPVITSPVNGAARLPSRVTLTSSTYSAVTGDPHVSTSWEISESPLFTNLAFQNINSAVDKTSWMVSGLQPAKEYYARVRYRGQLHEYTEWSPTSAFRTRLAFLPETEIGKSGSYNGVAADMDDTGGRWIVGSGNPSVAGNLCAAYIYRREGGVPVLEDTIQAVAGQKNIVTTIPAGGQLEVTVNGRYTSTKSYTQAEEIIVPAGAQTLTLVGKGSSSNEVTAFVVGNGSVQIPAGTTSLKLIGKGSDGTSVYDPGQPYIEAQSEIRMRSTGSFSILIGDQASTPVTGDYVAEFTSTTQAGFTSNLVVSEFTVTNLSGNFPQIITTNGNYLIFQGFNLQVLTNSLGNLVARYDSRYENVRVMASYYGQTHSGYGTREFFSEEFQIHILEGSPYVPEQPYIAPSTTTTNGISATMTIQGQTYTYPGGVGGPATPHTDNVTLNGTAQSLTYNIPTGGSGQYGYPGSTGVSQSLAGTGEYIFPLGTPKVSITAKGGDGASTANPTTYTGGVLITNTSNPYYVPGAQTYGSYGVEGTPTYDGENDLWLGQGGWISYSEGTPSTFTIQGITKTFPGGNGGPATVTTHEITLDGSDLSMNYSIPATGSGVVQYSVSTMYSNSFTGNGSHNVPADVTSVNITGRGQDGSPAVTEQLEYPERSTGVLVTPYGGWSTGGNANPSSISFSNPPSSVALDHFRTAVMSAEGVTIKTVGGVERKTVTYVCMDQWGGSGGLRCEYWAEKYNVLLPKPAKWVNPVISPIASHWVGKLGTIQWYDDNGGYNYNAAYGYIYLEPLTASPSEIPYAGVNNESYTSVVVGGTYRVVDHSDGAIIDIGTFTITYTVWAFGGSASNNYASAIILRSNSGYGPPPGSTNVTSTISNGNTTDANWGVYYDGGHNEYRVQPTITYTFQEAGPDLRTPATTGANTVVTFNGQTYTYPGGVGGPATSRNDVVNITAGSIKPLNYTVPQGGVVSLSYTTAVTPARETTATINGQTYTFPGSNSGAATNTTFTVDLVSNNNFGNGVAMNQDGSLAAICSSPRVGTTPGYVLVLQRTGTTWNIVDELNRADGLVWNAQSVSMDKTGNYILVGADAQPVGSNKIGSFAIYRRQAGKYAVEQTVIAPDPGIAYEAGSSVSLSGNASIAVIGAPAGGVASRTLVYERDNDNTFVLTATLSKTTDPHSADSFGTRVYISADGTTIAASSPTSRGVNTTHANCGEVIIFRKVDNVWTQVSTVRHPTPATGLYFGQDLHLSDDGFTLSVGVPGGTGGLGEVMFFDIEGSTVTYKSNVVSSAVTGGTNFGKAIALPGHSGDLVGASKFGTYVFD